MASRKQRGWNVPGFGLPLRWPEMQSRRWQPLFRPDENTLLLSVLDGSENPKFCYTVREIKMLSLINELTDMPDWERKIFDSDFTFEWKSRKLLTGQDITRSMLDWCVEEVKYYIYNFIPTRIIPALDGGVLKSDDVVDNSTKAAVKRSVSLLPRISSKAPDDLNEIVTHIVDPLLFPFAFDKTRTLRTGYIEPNECISKSGQGAPVNKPSDDECIEGERAKYPNDHAWSNHFQLLPFDVTFDTRGGGRTCISSYINNVHPINQYPFYRTLELVIDTILPLFNRTLIELKAPGHQNQRFHLAELGREPTIIREPGTFQPPEQRARAQWLDHQDRYHKYIYVDLKREFWNSGLQMILDITEINLTPQRPSYDGNDWCVHGQRNERICATAYYIYTAHNLSSSPRPSISFRRRINPEEAGLAKGYIFEPPLAPEIYGANDGDPVIQKLGDIGLKEGRTIVFPNIFQHRLNGFSLDDASKAGHLGILTLQLVDPNRPIMSTAMVPCQRRDWWASMIKRQCPTFWRLPTEIWDKIVDSVDGWPLSMKEGEDMRKEFAKERREFQRQHTKSMEAYLGWDLRDWSNE